MWNNEWKKGEDYPTWGNTDVYKKTISGGYLLDGETPRLKPFLIIFGMVGFVLLLLSFPTLVQIAVFLLVALVSTLLTLYKT